MRNGYPIERSQVQHCRHAENNERGGTSIEVALIVGALMMGLLVGVIFVMRNFSSAPWVLVSWWVVGAFGAAAGGAFRALADARRVRENESRQR